MLEIFNYVRAQNVPLPGSVGQVPGDTDINSYFGGLLAWAAYFAGAAALFYLIYAGILYISAGGDEEKASQGKKALTYAAIGIVIVLLAVVIVNWIIYLIGHSA